MCRIPNKHPMIKCYKPNLYDIKCGFGVLSLSVLLSLDCSRSGQKFHDGAVFHEGNRPLWLSMGVSFLWYPFVGFVFRETKTNTPILGSNKTSHPYIDYIQSKGSHCGLTRGRGTYMTSSGSESVGRDCSNERTLYAYLGGFQPSSYLFGFLGFSGSFH